MAHWAEIDNNNIVIRVVVTDNNDTAGDEGYSWLIENLGGTWVQTSYNTHGGVHSSGGIPLRKNYAAPGMIYDPEKDAFIYPKPYGLDSWVLDESTGLWVAPVPYPMNAEFEDQYIWDEDTISWILSDQ